MTSPYEGLKHTPGIVPVTLLAAAPHSSNEFYSTAFTGPVVSSSIPTPLPHFSPFLPQVTIPDVKQLKVIGGRHVLNVEMFTKAQLDALFNLAQAFRTAVQKDRCLDTVLRVSF